jgi:hypothetical protein
VLIISSTAAAKTAQAREPRSRGVKYPQSTALTCVNAGLERVRHDLAGMDWSKGLAKMSVI